MDIPARSDKTQKHHGKTLNHSAGSSASTACCSAHNAAHPQKIYVELTTKCNLHCRMCVRYAPGSSISEEEMPLAVFKKLEPSLAQAKSLILNGIGEPLLHPQLEEILRFSRKTMPAEALIGFQSNGLLLDDKKCCNLLSAGLSTICLSLDSLGEEAEASRDEHSAPAVARAMAALVAAKKQTGNNSFTIGLEMVLTRNNLHDLPRYIGWGAERGADYIIATHLLPYTAATEKLSLFNPNTTEAVSLFNAYNERAKILGLDLQDYPAIYMKYPKNEKEAATVKLFREMQKEARDREIFLHPQSLIQHLPDKAPEPDRIFAAARTIAERCGIRLFLPSNQALSERICPFINDQAAFVAASGTVMPCRFLWHTYCCRVLGENIQVLEYTLGDICRDSLENIWQIPRNRAFRREAGKYDYSPCWSCTQGPCADLINDNSHLANDCYGSTVPCGHCQWNLGGFQCL